jgi:preprotein translocase subunit YajC
MFLVRRDLEPSQCTMELQRGDWVKTESGEVGKVIHITRLTVFVAFAVPGKDDRVDAFLESQLTKTPPHKRAPQ